MNVYDDISVLKGVGPKTLRNLNKCCIFNILDLLLYFPRDYRSISTLKDLNYRSDKVIVNCRVKFIKRDIRTKSRKIISTVLFENQNGMFEGKWFNQPYMKKKFRIGDYCTLIGKPQNFRGKISIVNPVIVSSLKDKEVKDKIIPVYSLKEGITNNLFIKLVSDVLKSIHVCENLPEWIIEKYRLCSLDKAIRIIHNPPNFNKLKEARRRLKFQELFTYSLKVLMLKEYYNKNKKGIAFKISKELIALKERLPYKLTEGQNKVIREVLIDEKLDTPMNRLIQGRFDPLIL